jgi:imidazolonepropionase-like amidohydrolase
MRRLLAYHLVASLGIAGLLAAPGVATAQDVAVTNARIIVGNGTVIDSGTVIVRGGRIVSVSAGAVNAQGLRVIDAKGMSAMPGFIDGHKHVAPGPNEKGQMQSLLGRLRQSSPAAHGESNVAPAIASIPARSMAADHSLGASDLVDAGRSPCGGPGAGRQRNQAHR